MKSLRYMRGGRAKPLIVISLLCFSARIRPTRENKSYFTCLVYSMRDSRGSTWDYLVMWVSHGVFVSSISGMDLGAAAGLQN